MEESSIIYGAYMITSVKSNMDIETIHQWLARESYWAKNIPFEIVRTALNIHIR
jgi:hypothetical protein